MYIGRLLGGMPSICLDDIAITPAGIEYLDSNSMIERAKRLLNDIESIYAAFRAASGRTEAALKFLLFQTPGRSARRRRSLYSFLP